MAEKLDEKVMDLINDEKTTKVLVTTDRWGSPHAVVKQSLSADSAGNIIYLELLESSKSNRNLVRGIWYDRKLSIALHREGTSYQINGKPVKAHIAGPVFRKYYTQVREQLGDVDLAAVWIIEPEEVTDESFSVRRKQEESARPYFTHLDRVAKKEVSHA